MISDINNNEKKKLNKKKNCAPVGIRTHNLQMIYVCSGIQLNFFFFIL